MRKRLAMGLLLFVMAPVASSAQEPDNALIAAAKERLIARLQNPTNAQFRSVFVSRRAGVPVVCGEVAAPPSGAGSGNFVRFVGAGSLGVFLPGDVDDFGALWRHFCG